ncbi:hypothetical protein Droror1_Dr00013032 [Drosera rotundifolia]
MIVFGFNQLVATNLHKVQSIRKKHGHNAWKSHEEKMFSSSKHSNMRARIMLLVLVLLCFVDTLRAQLQVGFYSQSCGLAELVVKGEVIKGFMKDRGVVAGLLRLHFHDCFVRVRARSSPLFAVSFV